ncbi:hypothetical protein FOCG_18088 [Fusarium oxysporum f. sp. radicis-lycopersici 26381]|nr:hypothetical protein FOCG_18088 [Fusarium oxysporum f. sp. radicis-lycopersici 26381]
MNLVSVEKDWVVVVAEKDPEAFRIINAQMRLALQTTRSPLHRLDRWLFLRGSYRRIARTLSIVFEILATRFAPWLVGRTGAVRAGHWLGTCQIITLAAGLAVFWIYEDKSLLSATGLVVETILSPLGLRGFDLCIQPFV